LKKIKENEKAKNCSKTETNVEMTDWLQREESTKRRVSEKKKGKVKACFGNKRTHAGG